MRRALAVAVLTAAMVVAMMSTAFAFSCYVPDKPAHAGNRGVFTGNVFTGIDLPCQTARGSSTHGAQQPEGC